jgi:hypothetical protein
LKTFFSKEKKMNKHAAAAMILLCPILFLLNPGGFARAEEAKPIRPVRLEEITGE